MNKYYKNDSFVSLSEIFNYIKCKDNNKFLLMKLIKKVKIVIYTKIPINKIFKSVRIKIINKIK